jgi:hypothetical protein
MTRDRTNPDPRHIIILNLLKDYWRRENPTIPSLPWSPADAGALGQFLRANSNLSPDVVALCLENRLLSQDHAPAERVFRWILDVLRYSAGPLNTFGRPKCAPDGSSEASVGTYHPGESYTPEPEPQRPLREVMSSKWQDRTLYFHEHGQVLTDLERQYLREEGLL